MGQRLRDSRMFGTRATASLAIRITTIGPGLLTGRDMPECAAFVRRAPVHGQSDHRLCSDSQGLSCCYSSTTTTPSPGTWCNIFGALGQEVLVKRKRRAEPGRDSPACPTPSGDLSWPCTPNEAGISWPAIRRFAGEIPILGVCLGHQSPGPGVWRSVWYVPVR